MEDLKTLTKKHSLENDRVKLIPFTYQEAQKLEESFYEELLDHLEVVLDPTLSKFEAYLHHQQKAQEKGVFIFITIDKKTGTYAGSTQLKYIDYYNRKLEMGGTWYGKKFHGTGMNQVAKFLLFDFLFEVAGFRRIQFSIDKDNIASIKSMDKIGATYEGLFRNNWIDNEGISRDDVYYSLISSEWDKVKNEHFRNLT